jgi:hypothetical protein
VFTDYKINITRLQVFSQLSCLKLLFELNDKRRGVPALRRSLLNLNSRSNALAVGIIDFSVPTKIALEKNLQGTVDAEGEVALYPRTSRATQ